jgi:hypothetical protein
MTDYNLTSACVPNEHITDDHIPKIRWSEDIQNLLFKIQYFYLFFPVKQFRDIF